MPVHNGATYIASAVNSLLTQSFSDFELLVIDDGSSDETPEILGSIRDPRLRIVRNETNLGVPATRNLGLDLVKGEFIAFLDSDDVARRDRLDRQVRFLQKNADHVAVGSWARMIDENGTPGSILRRPLTWDRIRARTLFLGTMRTPSVMGRVDVLRKFRFRSEYPVCSDSDFWVRVALEHRCANLTEPLIDYRIHSSSITKSQRPEVRERKIAIARYLLESLEVDFDQQDLENHFKLRKPKKQRFDASYIDWVRDWLPKLVAANRAHSIFPVSEFNRAAGERWCAVYLSCSRGSDCDIDLFDPAVRTATLPYLSRVIPLGLRHGFGIV
jgi:glycosyltransferase involved in cell wall biosynthesis